MQQQLGSRYTTIDILFDLNVQELFYAERPWCATQIDDNGELTAFDYCDPSCPLASAETTPQMVADPNNANGKCCKLGPLAVILKM